MDYVHLAPAILYLIYSAIVFITDYWILESYYFYADGRDKDLDFWYQMSGLISMLFYLILSLKLYLKYRNKAQQEVSYADEIAFKWLQVFILTFGLILILRVLFFILNPEWGEFGSKYWYYLCFGILSVYVSISGYTSTIKTSILSKPSRLPKLFEIDAEIQNELPVQSPLEIERLNNLTLEMNECLDSKKLYKQQNLTLSDLAAHLNTNRNVISKVINQRFNMNFNDFINKKRAEAVIDQLKKEEHKSSTLLGIALDCGFNSKTTFNRAFKKHIGLTPKQYISKNQL